MPSTIAQPIKVTVPYVFGPLDAYIMYGKDRWYYNSYDEKGKPISAHYHVDVPR
jgi:hypothetical protein